MGVPDFLLRRLYRRGSLRETGPGRFAFHLRNILGDASIIAPPDVEVNGIRYAAHEVLVPGHPVERLSSTNPLVFHRGDEWMVELPGHLMRGGNRIDIRVRTREWGNLEIYVEDVAAAFCEIPGRRPRAQRMTAEEE